MTDNHMVFFAEIAFIYGGNDSLEKDVFGSERSSETTEKHIKHRFKCDFCEKTTKNALKNGLNIDLGIIILI